MKNNYFLRATLPFVLLLAPLITLAQTSGQVGIGTTTPTQKLDVDGNVRVRSLSGTGLRLPQVQADGTLTVGGTPLYSATTSAVAPLSTLTIGPGSDRVFRPVLRSGILYVPDGQNVYLYNVQTPAAPTPLSVLAGSATAVAVTTVGGRTLASLLDFDNNDLRVYDVTTPTAPSLLSTTASVTDDGQAAAIVGQGSLLYVSSTAVPSSGAARLAVWDISTPTRPVRRSAVATGGTDQLALSADGATLYVADNRTRTLRLLNVSNPSAPVVLSATSLGYSTVGLAVSGATLYTSSNDRNLRAYDVGTPAAPQLLGSLPLTGGGAVAVAGTQVLQTNAVAKALQLLDVSTPATPRLRATTPAPSVPINAPDEYPAWVVTDGTTAFVSIDFGGRVEAYTLGGPPRTVVVGSDGSLGSVPTVAPTLSLSGQTLSISGGNAVTLPTGADNLGNHTATQNLNLATYQLVGGTAAAPGSSGLRIGSDGHLGVGRTPATAQLQVLNSGGYEVAHLESGVSGPHLLLTKTGGGTATVDYIGTDASDSRAGALELRGVSSVQLSGNGDVSSPNLTVAASGNVGIGTTAPAARLEVNGAARVTALTTPATGPHNLLPMAYGSIGDTGSVYGSTDNYAVTHPAPGVYRLTFTAASGLRSTDLAAAGAATVATLYGAAPGLLTHTAGVGYVEVYTFGPGGTAANRGFTFGLFLP